MTDLIPPEALAAAAPVVKEALENLAPTIRRGAGALARHILNSTIASLQIGFSPYLHLSYARCRSVKTLLSQDRPLALLNIYVHLQMQCGDSHLSDDDLIEDLRQYRNIVITGLAGSGKSMLTKYMTIRFFENSNGMIPLFVELRQINLTKSPQLLNYIYQSCASAGNKISYAQFDLALRAGGLLLILDGFDEVEFKHRNEIENQILEISEKYPKSLIVLSSRPDERFAAWQLFYTSEVESLITSVGFNQ